jgi:hypothetical protein
MFGTPMVVLNSTKAIDDILEKRSVVTADRPSFTLMSAWCVILYHSFSLLSANLHGNRGGQDWQLFFLQSGAECSLQRRLFHQVLGPRACKDYETMLQTYAIENAMDLVKNPLEFRECLDM